MLRKERQRRKTFGYKFRMFWYQLEWKDVKKVLSLIVDIALGCGALLFLLFFLTIVPNLFR